MKIIRGLEHLSYERRLRIMFFQSRDGEGLFTKEHKDGDRGNGFKVKKGTYRLDLN